MTYAFVTMEVSAAVYDEIRAKLIEANYDHAIGDHGDDSERIDMHGLALIRAADKPKESYMRQVISAGPDIAKRSRPTRR